MTAAATTAQGLQNQTIDIAGQPVASLRSTLTAFIDTVLDNLAGIVAGPDELSGDIATSESARAAIVGNPDPRITRSLRIAAHHD